jgi:hypothetical protein
MANGESKFLELCGLWAGQTRDGRRYLSGTLGNVKVLVFPNEHRGDNEKAPTHRLMVAPVERTGDGRKPATDDELF